MDEDKSKELPKELPPSIRRTIPLVYVLGCALWPAVWYLISGYELMDHTPLLWFPFLSCFAMLIVNTILSSASTYSQPYPTELTAIQFVERNAAHMVTAITGALLIAAAIAVIREEASLPRDFLRFQSVAFIFAVVGVLPLYWIPSGKPAWLVVLRHLKTVPFTYAIALFLSGLLILLRDL